MLFEGECSCDRRFIHAILFADPSHDSNEFLVDGFFFFHVGGGVVSDFLRLPLRLLLSTPRLLLPHLPTRVLLLLQLGHSHLHAHGVVGLLVTHKPRSYRSQLPRFDDEGVGHKAGVAGRDGSSGGVFKVLRLVIGRLVVMPSSVANRDVVVIVELDGDPAFLGKWIQRVAQRDERAEENDLWL